MLFVVSILIVGIMSPGPAFLFVMDMAISRGRKGGVSAALGIALTNLAIAIAVLAGLIKILGNWGPLFHTAQFLGVSYLLFIAARGVLSNYKLLRSDGNSDETSRSTALAEGRSGPVSSLTQGAVVQVCNPKVWLFFTSALSGLDLAEADTHIVPIVLSVILFCSAAWYSAVAIGFSSKILRRNIRSFRFLSLASSFLLLLASIALLAYLMNLSYLEVDLNF